MIFIAGALALITVLVFLAGMVNVLKAQDTAGKAVNIIACILILAIGSGASYGLAYGYPQYLVWQQEQEGKAELAKAEQNRQIAIQEAKAKEESANNLANAKRIEAQAIADANKTIINSLNGPELYIQYLWTEALKSGNNQTIYVPSNAGIPITESNRLQK